MITRVLHLVLILTLLLPLPAPQAASQSSDLPYKIYLPIVANGRAPAKIYLPMIENAFTPPLCQVVYHSPTDGAYLPAGAVFDSTWVIQNTGMETWRSTGTEIVFTSGDSMHTSSDVRDLPYDVSPGAQLSVSIPMQAPSTVGAYVSNWALKESSLTLCQFYIKINVQ